MSKEQSRKDAELAKDVKKIEDAKHMSKQDIKATLNRINKNVGPKVKEDKD